MAKFKVNLSIPATMAEFKKNRHETVKKFRRNCSFTYYENNLPYSILKEYSLSKREKTLNELAPNEELFEEVCKLKVIGNVKQNLYEQCEEYERILETLNYIPKKTILEKIINTKSKLSKLIKIKESNFDKNVVLQREISKEKIINQN